MSEAPIGQRISATQHSEVGEHGAGIGLSGGVGESTHPIADKFMGQSGTTDYSALGTGRAPLAGGVTGAIDSEHPHHHHHHHHHAAQGVSLGNPVGATTTASGQAVSGAYEGGATSDALTGQSRAETTGPGVGPLGENVSQTSNIGASALAATAGGAAAGSGLSDSHANLSTAKGPVDAGVGPAGGAGGHYSATGAGAGAGASTGSGANAATGGGAGHFGNAEHDSTKGEPVSDPKSLDTGGPHSLVFQESTGTYVHRHEVEK